MPSDTYTLTRTVPLWGRRFRLPILLTTILLLLLNLTPPRFPLCIFHYVTGLDCPLCGLTRAMVSLARLHFVEAIHYNALSPLAAVMLLAGIWKHPAASRIWVVGAAAFAVYGLLRLLVPGI